MIPWTELAVATAPDGERLRLLRRGDEFSIRLPGGNELMKSRLGGSVEALATLALARLGSRPGPGVLIGGLGMGFTMRAAQAIAPPSARLVVSEIVCEMVGWAREHMAPVFGDGLSDSRLEVVLRDVGAMIGQAAASFDAILLDVDNGPEGLTRTGNDGLYSQNRLCAARRALTPGGVLSVWSAAPSAEFAARLLRCGFDASTHSVRAGKGKRGSRHTFWIAA